MNVDELISLLQSFDPETDVRMAVQPGDPFETTIDGAVSGEEFGKDGVVYLVEGVNLGEAPTDIWTLG